MFNAHVGESGAARFANEAVKKVSVEESGPLAHVTQGYDAIDAGDQGIKQQIADAMACVPHQASVARLVANGARHSS